MNQLENKQKTDDRMNRRNLISSLGKGLLALTIAAIPGLVKKQSIKVKIHPDAVQRKAGEKS